MTDIYTYDEEFHEVNDIPSASGLYVIDRDVFREIFFNHDYIELQHVKDYDMYVKPLVLCGECKLWENAFCNFHEMGMRAEDFCSYGVKA